MSADKTEMLKEMGRHVEGTTKKGQIMYEMATCICSAVDADVVNLYLVESEGEITKFVPEGNTLSL